MGRAHALELGYANLGASGASRIIRGLPGTLTEHRDIAVSQLCSLSGASMTTALRHIEQLEAVGYIERIPDPADRRRANVSMLPRLRNAAEEWLDLQIASSRATG
nr:MarR family winged helix-turn-helix transcriptional regulator [Sphingomonas melonis]